MRGVKRVSSVPISCPRCSGARGLQGTGLGAGSVNCPRCRTIRLLRHVALDVHGPLARLKSVSSHRQWPLIIEGEIIHSKPVGRKAEAGGPHPISGRRNRHGQTSTAGLTPYACAVCVTALVAMLIVLVLI